MAIDIEQIISPEGKRAKSILAKNNEGVQNTAVKQPQPAQQNADGTFNESELNRVFGIKTQPSTNTNTQYPKNGYDLIGPDPRETEEQKAKRLKRERSAKILAGVGDMVSSLANLYSTYHGAKSSYDPKNSLSARMQERFDKMEQMRKARDKEWLAGAMRAQQQDSLEAYRQARAELEKKRLQIQEEDKQRRRQDAIDRAAETAAFKQRVFEFQQEKFEHQKQVDEDKKNGVGTYVKKGRSGSSSRVGGYTTTTYDKNGNLVKTTVRQPAVTKPAGKTASTGRRGLLLPGKQASNTQRSGILLPKKKQK